MHLQSDEQTEGVNQTLGNLLKALVGKNPKQWDLRLLQAEFSYNNMPNRSTGCAPFLAVYG